MADSLNMVLDRTSSRAIIMFLGFTWCACIPIIKLTFGDIMRSVAVNTSFRISTPFWRHTTSQGPDNFNVDPRLLSGHIVQHLRPPSRLFVPASAAYGLCVGRVSGSGLLCRHTHSLRPAGLYGFEPAVLLCEGSWGITHACHLHLIVITFVKWPTLPFKDSAEELKIIPVQIPKKRNGLQYFWGQILNGYSTTPAFVTKILTPDL